MIKCKDCKHFFIDRKGAGGCYKADEDPRNHSCIQAERADGLQVCCATCKYFKEDDCNGIECEKEIFDYTNRAYLAIGALKCDKWQAREEKE